MSEPLSDEEILGLPKPASATERMPCGHLKGDWVEPDLPTVDKNDEQMMKFHLSYCRTCAEIKAARVESESNAAKHILTTAPDGCVCEPCISARTLTQAAYDRGVSDGIERTGAPT